MRCYTRCDQDANVSKRRTRAGVDVCCVFVRVKHLYIQRNIYFVDGLQLSINTTPKVLVRRVVPVHVRISINIYENMLHPALARLFYHIDRYILLFSFSRAKETGAAAIDCVVCVCARKCTKVILFGALRHGYLNAHTFC